MWYAAMKPGEGPLLLYHRQKLALRPGRPQAHRDQQGLQDDFTTCQEVPHACADIVAMCRAGSCQDELDKWCAAVKPGEGRLAKCLGDELAVEGQAGHKGVKISEGCKKELMSFKIQRSTNINMDLPLAKACKSDAEKFCASKYEVSSSCSTLIGLDQLQSLMQQVT